MLSPLNFVQSVQLGQSEKGIVWIYEDDKKRQYNNAKVVLSKQELFRNYLSCGADNLILPTSKVHLAKVKNRVNKTEFRSCVSCLLFRQNREMENIYFKDTIK